MKKLLRKLFSKPYTCCLEMHNELGCYCSVEHPCPPAGEGGAVEFFDKYHFMIVHQIAHKTNEEIIQDLISILGPRKARVQFAGKRIYFNDRRYIDLPPDGIFVYDENEIDMTV